MIDLNQTAWPSRIARVFLCTCMLLAGCNTLTHPAAKQQAYEHWSHVRARVKFQLAEQQCETRLFAEAVRTATESLSLDPMQVDVYVLIVRANLELSRIGSASQAIETAKRVGLESPDLIYMEGVILEQQGRTEEALARYAEAHALDNTNVDYLVATAESLVAAGRSDEALLLLDEYANRLDDDGTVGVLSAHVAALTGDVDGAVKRLSEAVVPPASTDVVAEELGLTLARSNRHEEALAVLEPLWDRQADGEPSGAVCRALGKCYLTLNDPARAKDALADYANQHPDDPAAQLLLAKAAVATGDLLTALRAADLAERHAPDDSEVKLVRAVIQWRRGDLTGAATSLDQILALNPRDVEAHCLAGEVSLARHQLDAARRHFRHALEINPHCTWAENALRRTG
ncbi:MAG: tetratricopeptide repeat protein [Phycisphaerales bacterium]|nr:MAG: tetratricopeptide repeat protein [Phycisphaerales bacterium]